MMPLKLPVGAEGEKEGAEIKLFVHRPLPGVGVHDEVPCFASTGWAYIFGEGIPACRWLCASQQLLSLKSTSNGLDQIAAVAVPAIAGFAITLSFEVLTT